MSIFTQSWKIAEQINRTRRHRLAIGFELLRVMPDRPIEQWTQDDFVEAMRAGMLRLGPSGLPIPSAAAFEAVDQQFGWAE